MGIYTFLDISIYTFFIYIFYIYFYIYVFTVTYSFLRRLLCLRFMFVNMGEHVCRDYYKSTFKVPLDDFNSLCIYIIPMPQ